MADFFAPSYWYGAGPDFSGLANAQASQAQTNNYLANQQNTLAQANAYNPFANSGGSFGAQPAYYAALGAAYGRATGGFRPGMPASPSGSVERGPDLPAPSIGNYNPLARGHTTNPGRGSLARIMAGGSGDQNGPSGTAGGQTASPYAQMFRMPQANPEYFNQGIYAGSQGSYGIPYNGRPLAGDIGFSRQPSYPNLGYNPGMQNWFANPDMAPTPSPTTGPRSGLPEVGTWGYQPTVSS